MKTKIVRIGNSQGVRIPKPLLEQAGLSDEVTLRVVDNGIVIEARHDPREGWEAAATLAREQNDDAVLDEYAPTAFDQAEWEW